MHLDAERSGSSEIGGLPKKGPLRALQTLRIEGYNAMVDVSDNDRSGGTLNSMNTISYDQIKGKDTTKGYAVVVKKLLEIMDTVSEL